MMPAKNSNKTWNIVHIPTREVLICEERGMKFGSGRTLNRHKTHQHASYKLICPECDYATTRKDNMRRHLIRFHKLNKVGTIMDNLQKIQTEQKNAKIRPKAPPSAPNSKIDKLKQFKDKGTNPYIYMLRPFPRTRRPTHGQWKQAPGQNQTKKFTTKPVTIPPK